MERSSLNRFGTSCTSRRTWADIKGMTTIIVNRVRCTLYWDLSVAVFYRYRTLETVIFALERFYIGHYVYSLWDVWDSQLGKPPNRSHRTPLLPCTRNSATENPLNETLPRYHPAWTVRMINFRERIADKIIQYTGINSLLASFAPWCILHWLQNRAA